MTDIFISYARSTARQARQVAETLRSLGYGVWRDDELPAHRAYGQVIEERLAAARAVVVIWSAEAVKSQWVFSEANRAREDGKLVQLKLDDTRLPMPFDAIQCAQMAGWSGDPDAPGWRNVVASIAELIGGPVAPVASAPAPRKLAICVLPFANMSGDPEQEYFSDGISEDIITDLSKVAALSVAARNTAFQFKGRSVDVSQVARQLNVSHVLEGSVRKSGGRVRITAQLIDGAAGDHVWAERYDRDLTDIFALQDEISEAIVAALKVKLLPQERRAIERRGTESVEAYDLILMARRHAQRQSAKRYDLVAGLCRGAIDLDPDYARAWALLATIETTKAAYSAAAADAGWAAADRALSLDPGLAEAHAAKGRLLLRQGRYEEAQTEVDAALRLDADSRDVNVTAGLLAVSTKRFEQAVGYFDTVCALDETDVGAPMMAMQCREALGDEAGVRAAAELAVTRVEKAIAAEPDNGAVLSYGVGALINLGEIARAREWAERALLLDPNDVLLRYNLGCGMIRAGETEFALDLLEESVRQGGRGHYVWAQSDTDLDPLREHPRFQAILAEAEARFALSDASSADGAVAP